MTNDETSEWLNEQWQDALTTREEPDPGVDRFVNSNVTSIRFAIVTQILGKIAEPTRDLLCLQRGDRVDADTSGRWDPRSFCSRIVVPWNRANENLLGASTDPYVNNPLRRPRLDEGLVNVHAGHRAEWEAVAEYLRGLQDQGDEAEVQAAFRHCLASAAARLAAQRFNYPTPIRISMRQLCGILDSFLEAPRGGLRLQVVSTALMRVLGDAFSLFSRIESQGLNEADRARNVPGDIMCYGPVDPATGFSEIVLSVDAKSAGLCLADVQASVIKARNSRVPNLLFITPRVLEDDRVAVEDLVSAEYTQGLNIYAMAAVDMVWASFPLLDEAYRAKLVVEIGQELDARTAPLDDRRAWVELLQALGQPTR